VVAEAVAGAVLLVTALAEWLHARRVRRAATLVFGPARRPAAWARPAPVVRAAAATAAAWGLVVLLQLPPRAHRAGGPPPEAEARDLVLVLDVSPSMRLQDARGPAGEPVSRANRAAEVLRSFFARIPMSRFRTSVVACYTGAKPVVVRTTDPEVVRNILTDLPMHFAFRAGPTDLISGVVEAARIAGPWRPGGTTLVVVSDGDTIPPAGMPTLPPSVAHVLVVGVGDPVAGRFIDGHQSRQDLSSLRQLATRLNGEYHNGNETHIPTDLVRDATADTVADPADAGSATRRDLALAAVVAGSAVWAFLPLALYYAGTGWRPGVTPGRLRQSTGNGGHPKPGARPERVPADATAS
jgi:Ca-activated chloride channel family protein